MVSQRAGHRFGGTEMTAPTRSTPETAPVWAVLDRVMDPEVPVLSVVELGIVRDVEVAADGTVTVCVTPTYSGCPAMRVIEEDIVSGAHRRPAGQVREFGRCMPPRGRPIG